MNKMFVYSKVYKEEEMNPALLNEKHELYDRNIKEWEDFKVAHDGGDTFIKEALFKYTFEEQETYDDRVKEGFVFNHCETIVDVYDFLLSEQIVTREWPKQLQKDPLFQMFLKDCDLEGTDYEAYINDSSKLSSVFGAVGVLVNKGANPGGTIGTAIRDQVYPYMSRYTLTNIFDWQFTKDPITHRRELSFLKIRDDDGYIHIWYKDLWQTWEIIDATAEGSGGKAILIETSENPLGMIPFFWFVNIKRTSHWYLGYSDIRGIINIVKSILRNLSSGEQIVKLASHPMMAVPMEESVDDADDDKEEKVGQERVWYYNPTYGPAGKPSWIETKIEEPLKAIANWIMIKTDNCFRRAHLDGVVGQRQSGQGESGLKLRYSYKQLFRVLSRKSDNIREAELTALKFYLKWMEAERLYPEIKIDRKKEFNIDELSIYLENLYSSMRNVISKTFRINVQNKIAKVTLPDMTDSEFDVIKKENELNTPEIPPMFDPDKDDPRNKSGRRDKDVRSALQARADHARDQDE